MSDFSNSKKKNTKSILNKLNYFITRYVTLNKISIIIWVIGFITIIFLIGFNVWLHTAWEAILALATWLLAGGVLLTFHQINEAKQSNSTQIILQIYRDFRRSGNIKKLRTIYLLEEPKNNDVLPPEEKLNDINYVLDTLEVVGHLSNKKVLEQWIVIETAFGLAALRCWYKLHRYIKELQAKRGYFADNFEAFTFSCIEYFERENIQPKLQLNDRKPIDLLEELKKPEICPRSYKKIRKQRKSEK